MRRVKVIIGLSIALLAIFLLWRHYALREPLESYARSQVLMGDVLVSIQLLGPFKARQEAWEAMGEAFSLARGLEAELSEHRKDSQTSALNRQAGQGTVPIGHHLHQLLLRSQELAQLSAGYFDVTVASDGPSDYRDLHVVVAVPEAGLRKTHMRITLSGIAKGYIVDQMAAQLRQAGWSDFLINAGGDLGAAGKGPDGAWSVWLDPAVDATPPLPCAVKLSNLSLATSGLSARGQHIIDPHTGRAAADTLASVSVIAPDTTTADALATALLAAGDNARHLWTKIQEVLPGTSAVLIDSTGHQEILTAAGPSPEITCQSSSTGSKQEHISERGL